MAGSTQLADGRGVCALPAGAGGGGIQAHPGAAAAAGRRRRRRGVDACAGAAPAQRRLSQVIIAALAPCSLLCSLPLALAPRCARCPRSLSPAVLSALGPPICFTRLAACAACCAAGTALAGLSSLLWSIAEVRLASTGHLACVSLQRAAAHLDGAALLPPLPAASCSGSST